MKVHEKLALYAPPFPMDSYFQMVDFAAEVGLKNVEILSILDFDKPDIDLAKRLRAYADEKGISFPCVSRGVDLVHGDKEELLADLKGYIDVAKILGSPYLHHTIAFEFADPTDIIQNKELYFERGVELAKAAYDYGQEQGILTIVEDQGYLFNGVEGYARFLKAADRGICAVADFGNIMEVEEKIEDFIPAFADRIKHAHIKDFGFALKDSREKTENDFYSINYNYVYDTALGKGDVNLDKAMDELKKINYNGYFGIEVCTNSKEEYVKLLEDCNKLLDNHNF